ncbi:MAG: NAD(+) diphosphatase [Desulfuromonas sp.]|nr:MAG: NAD(+) diphosphatase [Desulfuromonas sp.]
MTATATPRFVSTIDLPFNRAAFDDNFLLEVPDMDPGGPGVWLLLRGSSMLIVASGEGFSLPEGDLPLGLPNAEPLYIGRWQGRPCRLLALPHSLDLPEGLIKQPLRALEPLVSVAMLSLGGIGQMILHWEETSRHCGTCGEKMVRLPGEWGKECRSCGSHHFPRIHPCVIGLVVRGDELLLVHKGEWADGRYGLVAGFVEFGECLEEAMARETLEETGISITNIRYIGSQSWPFPSQLMCGFVADYAGGEIELRDQELADAKWFRLEELPTLPPSRSIARYLIDRAAEFVVR